MAIMLAGVHVQNASCSVADSVKTDTARFDADRATQQYLNQMSPEDKERSDKYFEGGYWLMLINLIYTFGVTMIFLSLGLSKWMKKIAGKAKRKNLQHLIYALLFLFFSYLLSFPLTLYAGFFREHAYNLSNMSFGAWFGDEMKNLAVTLVLFGPLIMLLYIAIRKTKENWWKWATAIFLVFMVIIIYISPVLLAPLFNKYEPLKESPLKEHILSLARANGVPADNVYRFDASKQSKRISANVSGIGSTIRISLNDNLLNRCNDAEIISVMAHETGHYVLNHTYKMLLSFGLLIFAGFAVVNWAMKKSLKRWGERWSITGIEDIGGLPLFIFIFSLFLFISSPIQNNISRVTEIEADCFELNAAREPDAFATVILKLSEYRKMDPGKWEEIIFYDHPSGRTRIYNAMRWKAEHLDEQEL